MPRFGKDHGREHYERMHPAKASRLRAAILKLLEAGPTRVGGLSYVLDLAGASQTDTSAVWRQLEREGLVTSYSDTTERNNPLMIELAPASRSGAEATAERLEQATADARQATRELHEAVQAAGDKLREVRTFLQGTRDEFRKYLAGQVEKEVAALNKATLDAVETATLKVYARFDKLTAALMDGDDGVGLERLAKNWRAQAEAARESALEPAAIPEFWARERKAGEVR